MARKKSEQLRTNEDALIEQSVLGQVSAPVSGGRWRVGPDGEVSMLPGVGGITYNCKVGDSALNWAADHVEPGVSIKADKEAENAALNTLACIGNTAVVVSGDAKGARGVVTGKHGGIEHVLVDLPDAALSKLVIGDKVQVRARGLGLAFLGMPRIALRNMSPELLRKMRVRRKGNRLAVPVRCCVPAALMGSGIGRSHTFSGDYDVQLFDEEVIARYDLRGLRLGDLVAIEDADHTFGRTYRPGALSVAVVVHSCATQSGHGPGLTTLITSRDGLIDPVPDPGANIANYLKAGRMRARPRRRG